MEIRCKRNYGLEELHECSNYRVKKKQQHNSDCIKWPLKLKHCQSFTAQYPCSIFLHCVSSKNGLMNELYFHNNKKYLAIKRTLIGYQQCYVKNHNIGRFMVALVMLMMTLIKKWMGKTSSICILGICTFLYFFSIFGNTRFTSKKST